MGASNPLPSSLTTTATTMDSSQLPHGKQLLPSSLTTTATNMDSSQQPHGKQPIVTKHQKLGLFFGDPLSTLDSSRKPTKCEVIRLWISVYDKVRGEKYLMPPTEKNKVLDDVVNIVMSLPVWENSPIMDYLSIRKKVSALVDLAVAFEKRCLQAQGLAA